MVKNEMSHKKTDRQYKRTGGFAPLAAAIIGSLLTLLLAPFFHIDVLSSTNKQSQQVVEGVVKTETGVTQVSQTNSIGDMIEDVSQAIVGVVNLQENNHPFLRSDEHVESGTGSGVIFKKVKDKAYIVTNYHVIRLAKEIDVSLYNGEKEHAKVVGFDPFTDLAVLEIPATHVTYIAAFGDSSLLRIGDQVFAIGNPLGLHLSRTVTQGIISGTERTIPVSTSEGEWELNVLQTDAAINPGNSGGALINREGKVIGINSLKISRNGIEGLGFAIPSNDVIPIVEEVIETGKVRRPYIGVSLVDLAHIHPTYVANLPVRVTEGAMVTKIEPESSAEKANLAVEDIIVAINDTDIKNAATFRKFLYTEVNKGDELKLTVYRNGKLIFVKLIIDDLRG